MKWILYILTVVLTMTTTFAQTEYTSTGAAGAYGLIHPSNINGMTPGLSFTFKANHVNPGASTLGVNGYIYAIKKGVNIDLDAGDIQVDQVVTVVFDGTNFQMVTPLGNLSGGGTATSVMDADGDTYVETELVGDEDVIHFNLGDGAGYAAQEYFSMNGPMLEVHNSGNSIFIGEGAGANDDLSTNYNVFVGHTAGNLNTSGDLNTAIGYIAMQNNSTGTRNVAIGSHSLAVNQTGADNVALGGSALYSNVAGDKAVAIGVYSQYYANDQTTPYSNNNVSIGYGSLWGSATPSANTGNYNTAIGTLSMQSNSSGYNNTSIGYNTLNANTTGYNNTAIGANSMYSNQTGNENISIGYQALSSNTAGSSNVAIGSEALRYSTGNSNNAIGYRALQNTSTGVFNSAFGYETLRFNTTSHRNTGFGSGTLINSTGANNTGLGADAGVTLTSGDNNTFIGKGADAGSSNLSNATAIGANAVVAQSNSLVLGGTGANAVNVGIGTSAPAYTLDVNGNTRVGYLGNAGIITIYPSDFLGEFGGASDFMVMQTSGTGPAYGVNTRAGSAALVAVVKIPVGYKASEVEVFGAAALTGSPFEVYQVSLIDGSYGANLMSSSGINNGAFTMDAPIAYDADNYMVIKIETGGNYITGAKVSISPL